MTAPPEDPALTGYRVFDPTDPHETNCGPFLCRETADGELVFAFRAAAHHCNSRGQLHGGLLMTFADLVLAGTAVHGDPDGAAVTVALTSHFVAAAGRGALVTSRATVDRRADANVFLSAAIHADDVLVLNCSAVMKRIDRRRLTAAARHDRQ